MTEEKNDNKKNQLDNEKKIHESCVAFSVSHRLYLIIQSLQYPFHSSPFTPYTRLYDFYH